MKEKSYKASILKEMAKQIESATVNGYTDSEMLKAILHSSIMEVTFSKPAQLSQSIKDAISETIDFIETEEQNND